jgi:hypothetical protein
LSRTPATRKWLPTILISGICCVALVLLVVGRMQKTPPAAPASAGEDWHKFEGTWTATCTRNVLSLGQERRATISTFSGSLLLAGPSRPGIGFRSQAIVFNDSATGLVGRAVWTDEKGEEVFSELRGEGTTAVNKVLGSFVGGTGRYAGATGTYEFRWQFLIENEEGLVQGQSIGLKGQIRVGTPQTMSRLGGPKS